MIGHDLIIARGTLIEGETDKSYELIGRYVLLLTKLAPNPRIKESDGYRLELQLDVYVEYSKNPWIFLTKERIAAEFESDRDRAYVKLAGEKKKIELRAENKTRRVRLLVRLVRVSRPYRREETRPKAKLKINEFSIGPP